MQDDQASGDDTDEQLHAGHEQQPLLEPKPSRTPLPILPLLVIFLIQLTEPITGTVIYPFINKFIRTIGVTGDDERKTGYFAGIIESLFFMGEAVTAFHWGRASDKLGRKPILLLGPLGLSFAVLSFGLSTNFIGLVVSRCLQGVFNGNIGVSKTVLAEVTDSTNIAEAYASMSVMWGTGSTLGPIIGGLLSEPASRWPSIFGKWTLFVQHPYFLPCAAAALLAASAIPIGLVGLKETAPAIILRNKRRLAAAKAGAGDTASLLDNVDVTNYGSQATVADNEVTAESGLPHPLPNDSSPPGRILDPIILVVWGFVTFSDMSVSVLQPLIWSTSTTLGGLGFDPYRIGVILGIWGFLNAVFQFSFLGRIIRQIGPKNAICTTLAGHVVSLTLYPLLRYLASTTGQVGVRVWVILLSQLAVAISGSFAFAGMQILVALNTPKESLGAANGMVQSVGCLLRAVSPTVASSLFAVSLERRLLGGNLVFLVLACGSLTGLHFASWLPEANW